MGRGLGFVEGRRGQRIPRVLESEPESGKGGSRTAPGHLLLPHFQEQARRDALKQRAEQSISEEPGWEEEEGKRY